MTNSKAKLLKEIETIKRALTPNEEPQEPPINWSLHLSQEDITAFRELQPKCELFIHKGLPIDWSIFDPEEKALIDKITRVYIKLRGKQHYSTMH